MWRVYMAYTIKWPRTSSSPCPCKPTKLKATPYPSVGLVPIEMHTVSIENQPGRYRERNSQLASWSLTLEHPAHHVSVFKISQFASWPIQSRCLMVFGADMAMTTQCNTWNIIYADAVSFCGRFRSSNKISSQIRLEKYLPLFVWSFRYVRVHVELSNTPKKPMLLLKEEHPISVLLSNQSAQRCMSTSMVLPLKWPYLVSPGWVFELF